MTTAKAATGKRRMSPGRVLLFLGGAVALAVGGYFGWEEWVARDHFRAARKAAEERKNDEVIEHLKACVEAWPDDAETAFLMARAARRKADLLTASDELARAEKLGWDSDAVSIERALQQAQGGHFRATQDKLLKAVRDGHPDSVHIVEVLGPMYASSFSMNLAREMLDKWVELQPKNPLPYLWIGDISMRLQQPIIAQEMYTKALELDPDLRGVRLRYVRFLVEVREPDAALHHLERLLEQDPKDREVRLLATRARSEVGQEAQARSLIEALLAEFPNDAIVAFERGRIELRLERYPEAEKWLRQAHQLAPFDAQICFSLAQVLDGNGKPDEAKKMRDRFAEIDRNQERVGILSLRIQQNPDNIDLRIELAIAFRRIGQPLGALEWLETAHQINPRSPRLHYEFALTYEMLGKPDRVEYHSRLAQQYAKEP